MIADSHACPYNARDGSSRTDIDPRSAMDQRETRDSFAELASRLRAGDEDAAAEVFRRFARRLVALARTKLDTWIRGKVDPEDVVQSAYKSFFIRNAAGLVELSDWDHLWGLLALITVRKCANKVEFFRAGRRDAKAEWTPGSAGDEGGDVAVFVDRDPTPLEAVILAETVEQLIRRFDPDERPIVELSLQGYSGREISARIGRAERTVSRVRVRLRDRLQRALEEDVGGPRRPEAPHGPMAGG
jgi:DNA-directed RNA polymerase specialized sigma24 family protein